MFLRIATEATALGAFYTAAKAIPAQNSPISAVLLKELQASLLTMINEERAIERVPPVAMNDLATRVAAAHAVDMARGKFVSHWGSDGRKPYHRYSSAGGIDATEENVSAASNTWSLKPADIAQDVAYLHVRLYNETPPNDGHRKTILAPKQTHVGIGIAMDALRLRVVELFVAKHVEVDRVKQTAQPGETIEFSGKLLEPEAILNYIEVFYEPLPLPPQLVWLQTPRPYSLPDESITLFPKLTGGLKYADGRRGIVEVNGRSFRTPLKLFKESPGLYTIACWIRSNKNEKSFIATLICIEAR